MTRRIVQWWLRRTTSSYIINPLLGDVTMADQHRISSFEEFWPYYLSEHRDPTSRRLHFAGTTGFFASALASAATTPATFLPSLAGFAAVLKKGFERGESESAAKGHIATMLGLGVLGSPVLFPAGVVCAYGCAWAGHFGYEKNTPATFSYPLWSFVGDLKMWSLMARGKLWSGDPLEELGLEDPTEREEAAEAVRNGDASRQGPLFGRS